MSGILLRSTAGALKISAHTAYAGDPVKTNAYPIQDATDDSIVQATVSELFGVVDALPSVTASVSDKLLTAPTSGPAEHITAFSRGPSSFNPTTADSQKYVRAQQLRWAFSHLGAYVPPTATELALYGNTGTALTPWWAFSGNLGVCSYDRDWLFSIYVKLHAENSFSRWFFGVHDGSVATMSASDAPALGHIGVQFSGSGLRGDAAPRFVTSSGAGQTFEALATDPALGGTGMRLTLKFTASIPKLELFKNGVSMGATTAGMTMPTTYNMKPTFVTRNGTNGKNCSLYVGVDPVFRAAVPSTYKL